MKEATKRLKTIRIGILSALCLGVSILSTSCTRIPMLELSVRLQPSAETARQGDRLTYTIISTSTLQNTYQFDLVQTFSLPVEIVSVTPDDNNVSCVRDNGRISCRGLELGPQSAQRVIEVTVVATTLGDLSSTVTLTPNVEIGVGYIPLKDTAVIHVVDNCCADLSIAVVDDPDPAVVGQILTYSITVTNNGPQTASEVVVTGSLPNLVSDCQPDQSGRCRLGSIAAGESRTFTARIDLEAPGVTTMTAEVGSATFDPNLGNNRVTESTTVTDQPTADLVVTITDDPDPVVIGSELTYTIIVRNNGPFRTRTSTRLVDTLPQGVTFVSARGGNCSYSSGTLDCFVEYDPADPVCPDCAVVTITVRPTLAGTISNLVTVSASEFDPNPANNSARAITTVNEPLLPDLLVTVSDSPDPVVENQPLAYVITVRNQGLGESLGAVVTATLPLSVNPGISTDFSCAQSGGNLVCQTPALGRLPSGGQLSLSLNVTPTVVGTVESTATVTSAGTDANPADNTFTESTTVSPRSPAADIAVTISDSPDPVVVDELVGYAVTVTNHGLHTATGIVLTVTLPAGVSFNDPSFVCSTVNGSQVCWISVPNLANGESETLTVNVRPTVTGLVALSAIASAAEEDPVPNNNSATETTTVVPPPATADLEVVSLGHSPDPAIANQQFAYAIVVRNNGLSDATNVVLSITLPGGIRSDGSPECPTGNALIQCQLTGIPAGSSRTINLSVTPSVTGTLTTTASVAAQEPDPNVNNNSRSVVTTIIPADTADLTMSIAAAPNSVTIPNQVTFTLVVQNTGPQTANGVTLTGFTLSSLEILDVFTSQGSCSLAPSFSCNIGSLANGGSATVTIRAMPFDPGVLTKTVTAAGVTNDPNAANNTASISVTVNPP